MLQDLQGLQLRSHGCSRSTAYARWKQYITPRKYLQICRDRIAGSTKVGAQRCLKRTVSNAHTSCARSPNDAHHGDAHQECQSCGCVALIVQSAAADVPLFWRNVGVALCKQPTSQTFALSKTHMLLQMIV